MKSAARFCLVLCLLIVSHAAFARDINPDTEARLGPQTLARKPIGATSYVLVDLVSGRLLAQRDARRRLFPASTTKIMTALVALRSGLPLDGEVKIGLNPSKVGESSIYLQAGEHLTLRQLLQAALVKSANDACVAIAEAVTGDVPSFVARMNSTAKELGARDTHFVNPHGLHDPQHFTTAHDLSLIARAALQYPAFNAIVRTKEVRLPGNALVGPVRLLMNRDRLLWRWPACDGVKTGYTHPAGRCLVSTATQRAPDGRPWRLLSVVLHAVDSWSDAANLLQHHGFEQFTPVDVAQKGESAGRFEARGANTPTEAVTTRSLRLPLRPQQARALQKRLMLWDVAAPLRSGQPVGAWEFWAGGRKLDAVPLVARDDVAANALARFAPFPGNWLPVSPGRRTLLMALLLALTATLSAAALLLRRVRHDTLRKRHPRRRIAR